MGLFSFVKDTGLKLFAGTSTEIQNTEKEDKIFDHVTKMGYPLKKFSVDVEGDIATISGEAPDQASREKVILTVGNVEGVSQVNDQITVAQPQTAEPKFYVVKSGDSLSKIAKEYYGDPMKYPEIFEANKPMLKDPDEIYPGQTLRIPTL